MRSLGALFVIAVLALAPLAAGAADGPAATDEVGEIEDIEEIDAVEVVAIDPAWDPRNVPILDRIVSLPTARTSRPRSFRFVVDHRTYHFIREGSALDDMAFHFFGFDTGSLKIGLGLRYGILDDLEVGVYRLNQARLAFDVYEFDAKYRILQQDEHHVSLALRAGVTWFAQQAAEDAAGGFGQLLVDRALWDRLTLELGLGFHSESTGEKKRPSDTAWSLAVFGGLDVRILPWLSWNVELAANVAGYGEAWPAFSSSLTFLTNRHTFALVLANTQYMSADGIVANSDRGFDDLVVGFTITRELAF